MATSKNDEQESERTSERALEPIALNSPSFEAGRRPGAARGMYVVDGGDGAVVTTSVRCFLLLMFCYVPAPRRGRGHADAAAFATSAKLQWPPRTPPPPLGCVPAAVFQRLPRRIAT